MTDGMRHILDCLKGKRFPLEDEKETQAAIFEVLHARFGGAVERERRIVGGIIDFFVSDGTGIEAKIKGQRAAIVRQVGKYLKEEALTGLVLVTAKPVFLPVTDKPVHVFDIGSAWL
jgi:hypothetical protein